MNDLRHFIVFRRTDGHCAAWLMRADSLRAALVKYIDDILGDIREDGSIAMSDGHGGEIIYEHPLACIEAYEKTFDSRDGWNGWQVGELDERHWQAGFAEVLCSEHPGDVQCLVDLCRPLLRQSFPRSRARGFVWYLQSGPLVTFYRPAKRGRRWPMEVLNRYLIPWSEYPQAQVWSGTCDDILEQLVIEYPQPYVRSL